MKKNIINKVKQILRAGISFAAAFLAVNLLCFLYFNPMHGTELNPYRVEPDSNGIYAVEGFGILHSDRNGFANRDGELTEKGYILVMGSSQSKGDQVLRKYRYSDILDKEYGEDEDDQIHVYNTAFNGGRFSHIIKNFKDIITEFPDSAAVIIELSDGTVRMTEEEFRDAMNQVEYESSLHGEELKHHDLMGNIAAAIKKYCPLALLSYDQLTRKSFTEIENAFFHGNKQNIRGYEEEAEDNEILYQYFSQALQLIRSEYSGKIIVLYHEPLTMEEMKTAEVHTGIVTEYLEKACAENSISFINMEEKFLEAYLEENSLPYGFHNTEMGTGHLNKAGHKMIAESLLVELKGMIE